MERIPELLRAIRATFDNCDVRPDERVVVFTDTNRPDEVGDLFLAEAIARGCPAALIRTEARRPMVVPTPAAMAAMQEANIVFDLSSNSWLYTKAHNQVIRTGHTRMLQILCSIDTLIDRPPSREMIAMARRAKELFDGATPQVVRITSELGTDFSAEYTGRPVNPQDTVVLKPGDWDSVGTGFGNCFPIETTGEGVIVVNGPCHHTGGMNYIPEETIKLTLEGGRIVDIEGGAEAKQFKRWIESYNDDHMHVLAHVGFGYDRRCGPPPKPVSTGDFVSWEAIYGGVIVAFGANLGRSGGQNAAPGHCDLILLQANLFLGGQQIISGGEFVVVDGFA